MPRSCCATTAVSRPPCAPRGWDSAPQPDQCRSGSRAPANARGVRSDGGRPSPSDAHTPRQNRQLPPPPLAQVNAAHQDAKPPSADRPQMILVGEAGRLYPLSWRIPPSWKMATPTSPGYAALISSHHQLSGIARISLRSEYACSAPSNGRPSPRPNGTFTVRLHGTTEYLLSRCAGLRTTWKQNGAYVVPGQNRVLFWKRKFPLTYWINGDYLVAGVGFEPTTFRL